MKKVHGAGEAQFDRRGVQRVTRSPGAVGVPLDHARLLSP